MREEKRRIKPKGDNLKKILFLKLVEIKLIFSARDMRASDFRFLTSICFYEIDNYVPLQCFVPSYFLSLVHIHYTYLLRLFSQVFSNIA